MPDCSSFGWSADQYALIDFGGGRKLERFGNLVLDRPSPAAMFSNRSLARHNSRVTSGGEAVASWEQADVRLDDSGRLVAGESPQAGWQCRFGALVFQLKLTPFGHVGLFPEQAANWQWLAAYCTQYPQSSSGNFSALNLFAYTGGTTMCLAAAGGRVVHVDASAPAVKWARANARASGYAERPIRWIVDDARKFVARELRRGNRYDVIVLDPPSYGHGAAGERFEIASHLPDLITDCLQLLAADGGALLLSAHCEDPAPTTIIDWIHPLLGQGGVEHARLTLPTQFDKSLDAGFYVRATRRSTFLAGDARL